MSLNTPTDRSSTFLERISRRIMLATTGGMCGLALPTFLQLQGSAAADYDAGATWSNRIEMKLRERSHPAAFPLIHGEKVLILQPTGSVKPNRPWVIYFPTLIPWLVDNLERANSPLSNVVEDLLDHGYYVCGIDAGENYGRAAAVESHEALYAYMRKHYAVRAKANLLAQSRGGLTAYNWASRYPQRVRSIYGIYTVTDMRTYPGLKEAASAHGIDLLTFEHCYRQYNPVDILSPLARHQVPIRQAHGQADKPVPYRENALTLAENYRRLGGNITLVPLPERGHEEVPEFFVAKDILAFFDSAGPLSLHPENPHYFLFRDKPAILITSGEHYGAVLNQDFDYNRYLDELAAHGLNLTRAFSGTYVELRGVIEFARNTLAPKEERFLCPWARSDQPGYAGGGNKFDLSKWDDAYFRRLKDFVAQAGKRGVVVEMNLFCPMYAETHWKLSPQNAANNVNGLGNCGKDEAHTLDKSAGLLEVQEKMTRKIAAELAEFDNLYYEVCNEPYFGGVSIEWQHHMVDCLVAAEKDLPSKHLISMNIANGNRKVERPHPAVSIFNFHYASPPDAVPENYSLNKVIGDNETGFKGTADAPYRREAWEFLLAGGGLFNHLDYSFATGQEDGSFEYPSTQAGGGNRGYRGQLNVLREFLAGFEFLRMKPDAAVVKNKLPKDGRCYALVEPGRQYAVYVNGILSGDMSLDLPEGNYRAEWIDVLTGQVAALHDVKSSGGVTSIPTPKYTSEIALRVMHAR
ncbi:MAG TPA: hypothetical protein VMV69_04410 [Pirellulales bacterium]|nr:hypothetical protein [Pirellulales bacterium]